MTARRHCSSWADLHPELLGLVLQRLPSPADRARLRAVCKAWRREILPVPFPWLCLLDGTFLTVPEGDVPHFPSLLGDEDDALCHGSVGSWLFLERTNDRSMSLVNLFSGDTITLPDADTIRHHDNDDDHDARPMMYKPPVPLSSSSSPDSLLFAVLMTVGGFESVISICNSATTAAFRVPRSEVRICDIAFVGGKLYALSPKKLFVVDVDSSRRAGEPKVPSMECIDDDVDNPGDMYKTIGGESYRCAYWSYLVESRGKLLHVRRLVGHLSTLVPQQYCYMDRSRTYMDRSRTFSFEVFEADLTVRSCVQWRRVHSLGGQALFVGPSSKSLLASECGARPDCIYFMADYDWARCYRKDPLCDCGVFNMRDGTITPLLPGTMVMRPNDDNDDDDDEDEEFYLERVRPGWFFPC